MLRFVLFLFWFQQYNCYLVLSNRNISLEVSFSKFRAHNRSTHLPDSFDWRHENMVSPVKNQKSCAACWAFAINAAIESHLKIFLNEEVTLSEQFLIDCVEANKTTNCEQGNILKALGYIVNDFGGVLAEEHYYPYANHQLECRWRNMQPKPIPVIGYRRVPPDEEAMITYLFFHGPLSAAINSSSMKYYTKGIDEPAEDCRSDTLDHAVLIVGYSTHVSASGKRTPYWIIKNSWGEEWGDHGYYYMVRGRNACGIATDVSFPFVN